MNLQQKIQDLSVMRNELYAEAGEVSLSNPEQARKLWAAADALVVAMEFLGEAEDLGLKAAARESNPFDELMA